MPINSLGISANLEILEKQNTNFIGKNIFSSI